MPAAPACQASAQAISASLASATRASMVKYSEMIRLLLALCLISWLSSGCYYAHLAKGQARLLAARRPIPELLVDPEIDPELREQLKRVVEVREFAEQLGLDVGKKYTTYAAWPGDRIITNLVATRPGEIDAVESCFPIAGCVPYRGFFEPELAEASADGLRAKGLDVCLTGVSAYSTLGWMNDPVTGPMLQQGELSFVETLLHELVHATVYLKDEPDFNEGVANFIGQEAAIRFFRAHPPRSTEDGAPPPSPRDRMLDNRAITGALVEARDAVASLYAQDWPDAERERLRFEVEQSSRNRIAKLTLRTRSRKEMLKVAERIRLNDACLALRETYSGNQERYAEVLEHFDGDLKALVQHLERAAAAPDPVAAFFAGTIDEELR
jgi:predicted aminopeptidase